MEANFQEMLNQYTGRVDGHGRRVLVHNCFLLGREIQTGIGPVRVRVPKVRPPDTDSKGLSLGAVSP